VGKASSEETRRFTPHNQFAREMDHFAERIRSGQEAHTPGEEGLQDQRIMEAIYQAADGGSPVKLPMTKQIDSTRGPVPEDARS
jgi:predicted dehydrogenase